MSIERNATGGIHIREKGRSVVCPVCERAFTPHAVNQVYCTRKCKMAAARNRERYGYAADIFFGESVCPACGRKFERRTTNQIYCSKTCQTASWKLGMAALLRKKAFKPRTFACAQCGKRVVVSDPSDGRGRFCCEACERQYWRCATKRRFETRKSGTKAS